MLIAIIGPKAHETFEIAEYIVGDKKLGRVVEKNPEDLQLNINVDELDLDDLLDD